MNFSTLTKAELEQRIAELDKKIVEVESRKVSAMVELVTAKSDLESIASKANKKLRPGTKEYLEAHIEARQEMIEENNAHNAVLEQEIVGLRRELKSFVN